MTGHLVLLEDKDNVEGNVEDIKDNLKDKVKQMMESEEA